jgi:segregation and condensation protein B
MMSEIETPEAEFVEEAGLMAPGAPGEKPPEPMEAESEPAIVGEVARPEDLLAPVEALLLATGEPLSTGDLASLLRAPKGVVLEALEKLRARFADESHGLDVVEIAGGWQLGTKPAFSSLVEKMLREIRKVRLSPAALETLAIIAYRQPVTRAEIEAIRGVNVDGVMKTLLDRDLIRITGKKDEVGKPLLYGSSENFLMHFGLRALSDLPPLSEFDEIARAKADVAKEPEGPDWYLISSSQREALDALQDAAERELSDLDAKLKAIKPPKVEKPEA